MLGIFNSSCRRMKGCTPDEAPNPLVSHCEVERCRKLGILHVKHGNITHCHCIAHRPKIQATQRKSLQCSICKEIVVDIHIIDLRDASIVEIEESSLSVIQSVTPLNSAKSSSIRHLSFDLESEDSSFRGRAPRSCFQKVMIGTAVAVYGVGCYFLGVYINNC